MSNTLEKTPLTRLCHCDDIESQGARGFDLAEQALFVVRRFDRFYIYRNRCPHLGLRLEWMPNRFLDSDNELIQCATHGALFIIESGECVAGPCQGATLQALDFEIKDGWIYVDISEV